MASAAQMITISSKDPLLSVTALRGQTPPVPVGGTGGWSKVARPHRVALTQWTGIDPPGLTFSLILDGVRTGSSVEADCDKLERMAQPAGDRKPPPIVAVAGGMPHTDRDYVIDSLVFDTAPSYGPEGHRQRQEVTVTLLQHVDADVVQTAAAKARAQTPPVSKTYVVKTGDTLTSIAAHELGSAAKWTSIASLNGIHDPKAVKAGQRLKLP